MRAISYNGAVFGELSVRVSHDFADSRTLKPKKKLKNLNLQKKEESEKHSKDEANQKRFYRHQKMWVISVSFCWSAIVSSHSFTTDYHSLPITNITATCTVSLYSALGTDVVQSFIAVFSHMHHAPSHTMCCNFLSSIGSFTIQLADFSFICRFNKHPSIWIICEFQVLPLCQFVLWPAVPSHQFFFCLFVGVSAFLSVTGWSNELYSDLLSFCDVLTNRNSSPMCAFSIIFRFPF